MPQYTSHPSSTLATASYALWPHYLQILVRSGKSTLQSWDIATQDLVTFSSVTFIRSQFVESFVVCSNFNNFWPGNTRTNFYQSLFKHLLNSHISPFSSLILSLPLLVILPFSLSLSFLLFLDLLQCFFGRVFQPAFGHLHTQSWSKRLFCHLQICTNHINIIQICHSKGISKLEAGNVARTCRSINF